MSINALLPNNEAARLKALCQCEILDTSQDKAFDDITRLAADICGTPIALITLIDTERQWFKSKVGADITENPLHVGFCPFVIQKGDSLIIPNTLADEQYATNPVVVSTPYVRFYAGVPLTTADGHILGTICVIDYVPHELSPKQIEALQALSRQVMTQIELRHSLIGLSLTNAELKRSQSELQKANDELEIRVKNRTTELRNACSQLQSEITERKQVEEMLRNDAKRLSAIIATQYDIATAELDLNKVMNLIVERTQNLTCASGAAIELVEGDEMVYHATSGTVADYTGLRLKIAASLSGQCVRTGEILRCNDAELDPRVDIVACRRVGARSMIVVPLHHERKVVGVLKVLSPQAHAFGERDVQTLQLMAGLIAAAMSHASEFSAKQAQINERKLAEEVLTENVRELEKLNALKDDFLSTVSHELRTPIANMKMAIQMLKLSPTAEKSQRYLEILQAECTRETNLINDLLDLQRLEAGSYPILLNEAVSLQMLSTIIEPFRVRTGQLKQTLQINLTPDLPSLVTNRASLERILAELLNNACKYTPCGGEIVLNVCQKSTEAATIFTISNPTEIPSDQLPRIFEKFYRVPQGDRWQQGGTGLGLALVQKLVEQLQGTILVESFNGWTTFTVVLPNQLRA
ncbi:MAG: GAF domain-containing protein [Gloeocapsa sp. UFS-A4-WI-NPMV-4B04]|jgi:signal transduction histidine kinase|nr:GAF domain-containing protein [Gloeocapsa sp. UFS-A4-WI-NPMV-4B04]